MWPDVDRKKEKYIKKKQPKPKAYFLDRTMLDEMFFPELLQLNQEFRINLNKELRININSAMIFFFLETEQRKARNNSLSTTATHHALTVWVLHPVLVCSFQKGWSKKNSVAESITT